MGCKIPPQREPQKERGSFKKNKRLSQILRKITEVQMNQWRAESLGVMQSV